MRTVNHLTKNRGKLAPCSGVCFHPGYVPGVPNPYRHGLDADGKALEQVFFDVTKDTREA